MDVSRKINWKKLGLVIKPNKTKFWEAKYCMLPTPLKLNNNGLFRIFYSTRNKNNQSIITFTDIDIKKKLKSVNNLSCHLYYQVNLDVLMIMVLHLLV